MWAGITDRVTKMRTAAGTLLQQVDEALEESVFEYEADNADGRHPAPPRDHASELEVCKTMLQDLQFQQLEVSREYQKLFAEKEEEVSKWRTEAQRLGSTLASPTGDKPGAEAPSAGAGAGSDAANCSAESKVHLTDDEAERLITENTDLKSKVAMWEPKLKSLITAKTEATLARLQSEEALRKCRAECADLQSQLAMQTKMVEKFAEERTRLDNGSDDALDKLASEYSQLARESSENADRAAKKVAKLRTERESLKRQLEQVQAQVDHQSKAIAELTALDADESATAQGSGETSDSDLASVVTDLRKQLSRTHLQNEELQLKVEVTNRQLSDLSSVLETERSQKEAVADADSGSSSLSSDVRAGAGAGSAAGAAIAKEELDAAVAAAVQAAKDEAAKQHDAAVAALKEQLKQQADATREAAVSAAMSAAAAEREAAVTRAVADATNSATSTAALQANMDKDAAVTAAVADAVKTAEAAAAKALESAVADAVKKAQEEAAAAQEAALAKEKADAAAAQAAAVEAARADAAASATSAQSQAAKDNEAAVASAVAAAVQDAEAKAAESKEQAIKEALDKANADAAAAQAAAVEAAAQEARKAATEEAQAAATKAQEAAVAEAVKAAEADAAEARAAAVKAAEASSSSEVREQVLAEAEKAKEAAVKAAVEAAVNDTTTKLNAEAQAALDAAVAAAKVESTEATRKEVQAQADTDKEAAVQAAVTAAKEEAAVAAQAALETAVDAAKKEASAATKTECEAAAAVERDAAVKKAVEDAVTSTQTAADAAKAAAVEAAKKEASEAKAAELAVTHKAELEAAIAATVTTMKDDKAKALSENDAKWEADKKSALEELAAAAAAEKEQIAQTVRDKTMAENREALEAMRREGDRRVEAKEQEMMGFKDMYVKESRRRKKIHNALMEMKGNIRVFCRVRPILDVERSRAGAGQSVNVMKYPIDDEIIVRQDESGLISKRFEFDKVFQPTSTQEEVFAEVQPLVVSAMDGYNVCIFAYGQTGSGKTFTMEGPVDNRGVNFRTLGSLFEEAATRSADYDVELKVSMLEIYNEMVRDLLSTDAKKSLDIRQMPGGGVFVQNLVQERVSSLEDVEKCMQAGYKNRAVGSHNVNEHSSRSHLVLSVEVATTGKIDGRVARGKLHLIDLAGSERVGKTDASGARLKEAQNINRSLSALGDVVAALAKKGSHVPFRNSKLTYLLQDSLGGDSKVLMFVNCSPVLWNAPETMCSLNFATRCRSVELGSAKKNSDSAEVARLRRMIESMGGSAGAGAGAGSGGSRRR